MYRILHYGKEKENCCKTKDNKEDHKAKNYQATKIAEETSPITGDVFLNKKTLRSQSP